MAEAIPNIWVCTAPLVAVLHTSEFLTTTLGADAVGTDLSVTTVELTVLVSAPRAEFIKELKRKKIKAEIHKPINKGFHIIVIASY